MDGARTHRALTAQQTADPTMSGVRRPNRSESWPMTSCPPARPIKNAVKLSWIDDGDACRSCAIRGKPDRYMSIENGATALSATNTAISAHGLRIDSSTEEE